jgi:ketosteroid isomerase-like protein
MKFPEIITNLLVAQEKYDSEAFAENFSDDAVVYDEHQTYFGKKEIQKWNETTNTKYKTKYEALEISTGGEKIRMLIKVSGTFDGSPITLTYHFETKNEKIILLNIN